MNFKRLLVVMLVAIASCGSDSTTTTNADAETSTTSTTLPQSHQLSVTAIAETQGLGSCTYSPVTRSTQLVVKDGDGSTISTGSFEISTGRDGCAWTGTADGVPPADFYEIVSGGVSLGTVSADEMSAMSWRVEFALRPGSIKLVR